MAHDALDFLSAMNVEQVDLLGFSIGSFVAQEIALRRPDILRRLILASSAPKGAAGMHGWAPDVIRAVGQPQPNPDGYLDVFFAGSPAAQAGQQALTRMFGQAARSRPADDLGDAPGSVRRRVRVGDPEPRSLQRLSAIDVPVLVANGDSDPMILPHYSYLVAGLVPEARLKIYPDSAHGFLFQHHEQFAADVDAFLS